MRDMSNDSVLAEVGIDKSKLDNQGVLAPEEMLSQLEQSFGVVPAGSYEKRISKLESTMTAMMVRWGELTR